MCVCVRVRACVGVCVRERDWMGVQGGRVCVQELRECSRSERVRVRESARVRGPRAVEGGFDVCVWVGGWMGVGG